MAVACKQRFTQGSVGSSEAPCPTYHHAEGTSERRWGRSGEVYASDICRFRSAADEIKESSRDNIEYCVIPVTIDAVRGGTYA